MAFAREIVEFTNQVRCFLKMISDKKQTVRGVILLMEETLHQLIGYPVIPLFTRFYTSQVVGLGISEPSTALIRL